MNFFELFSNRAAVENDTVLQGEIVVVDSRIKCSSHRSRTLAYDIKKKIDFLFKSTVSHGVA